MKNNLIEIDNINWIYSTNWDNEQLTIFIPWFERIWTTEEKFRKLSKEILNNNISDILRFDFSWTWLSEWDFKNTTITSLSLEFEKILKKYKWKIINIVAHSLWAVVLAQNLTKNEFNKIILIAPALNQKDLIRYWFVKWKIKKEKPELKITWDNYNDFLDEKEFLEDCEKTWKMTKKNYIDPNYFLEAKELDLSNAFSGFENILHIHWDKDEAVPLKSLDYNFKNSIIVDWWDHDMEKPILFEKWENKVIDFLKN